MSNFAYSFIVNWTIVGFIPRPAQHIRCYSAVTQLWRFPHVICTSTTAQGAHKCYKSLSTGHFIIHILTETSNTDYCVLRV
jgi:hypothetical protein